jgi:nitrogen PTS system EIIA component
MMDIAELITPQSIVANLKVANKRQLLQDLARRAAPLVSLHEKTIFDTLLERERLGSTGIGSGTAVPHGRFANLARIFGLFARLDKPIPFESVDDQPVDLVFLLLTPDSAGADHLKALARVSRLFRDRAVCAKLRGTDRADALYALLTDRAASHAA